MILWIDWKPDNDRTFNCSRYCSSFHINCRGIRKVILIKCRLNISFWNRVLHCWHSNTQIPLSLMIRYKDSCPFFYLYQGQHFNSTSFSKESIFLFFSSVKFSFVKRFIMTLEQTSETKTDKSGAKVTTKRTVKTFFAKGAQETTTPWGVTLKPVPRKKIVEEIIKNDSKPNERPSPSRPLPKLNTSKVRGWFIDIYR